MKEKYQPSPEELKKAEDIMPEEENLRLTIEELKKLKEEYVSHLTSDNLTSEQRKDLNKGWFHDEDLDLWSKFDAVFNLEFKDVPEIIISPKKMDTSNISRVGDLKKLSLKVYDKELTVARREDLVVGREDYGGHVGPKLYKFIESDEDVSNLLEEAKKDALKEVADIEKVESIFEKK